MAKTEKCKECSSYKGICKLCEDSNYYSEPQEIVKSGIPQIFGGSDNLFETEDYDI